jgi:hypothetical protein
MEKVKNIQSMLYWSPRSGGAFSVCGRFGCRLPGTSKKEKVPKRKKYYQILYFSLYK